MRRPLSVPTRRPIAVLALATAGVAAMSACGPHIDLAVNLRNVSITVPKLAAPAREADPPAPPLPAPPPPAPVTVAQIIAAPPPPSAAPATSAPAVVVKPPPAPACPQADQLAAPDVPASVNLPHIPAREQFTQNAAGMYAIASAAPPAGSLAGAVTTVITPMPQTTNMVGQLFDNWAVVETDAKGGLQAETYQLAEPSASPAATTPAVYLNGLAWKDARGTLVYQPTGGGIRIIPIPVSLATSPTVPQYFTTATDPSTGTTLFLNGSVVGKKRVDLCGRIADSYEVHLTGTLTSPTAQYQVDWVKDVATQYGGQDVSNALTLTQPADSAFAFARTLTRTTIPLDPR